MEQTKGVADPGTAMLDAAEQQGWHTEAGSKVALPFFMHIPNRNR